MKDSDSLDRVEALFHQVVELPITERGAFLDRACGEDRKLRSQIQRLLDVEARDEGFLADPTVEPAPLAEKEDPLIGSEVGPYKLLQVIGEGGYGTVYLAEQREPVIRRVALKVIKLGMDTRQVIARFEAERQALAMMDHPNIAKVLDAGATDAGRPYFVMELVRGTPITEYCCHGQLDTKNRLALFINVCHAVQHAHQKGVIHRDLKPSNILVTLHDGVPVPKVIDFGIAKATNVRLTEKTLFTEFHQFMGTPAYTSPEQVEMSGLDIDTRSDIYSLGVLLYELLTGTTPIEAETFRNAAHLEIQRTILEVEPPKPSTRVTEIQKRALTGSETRFPNAQIDQDLDWIAMKALEKDRERRYGSAVALAQDVACFLRQEPVAAGAPGAGYQLRKFASRHRKALLTATTLIAMLVCGSVFSVWQAVRATNASHRERSAREEAQAQAQQAQRSALEARRNLYFADMNVVQSDVASGNVESAIQRLQRHIPQSGQEDLRHFEWRHFWQQTHRERFTLLADDDPNDETDPDAIYDLDFSPTGNLLASASRTGRFRVWDMTTRQELFQFQSEPAGHPFAWVEFSPDGRLLACSRRLSGEKVSPEVIVWDVRQRAEVRRYSVAPARYAIDPRFTNDGETLIAGDERGHVWFWDLDSGESHSVQGHATEVTSVAIAEGAPRMVTCAQHDGVTVWDLETNQVILEVKNASHPEWYDFLSGASIDPDGKRIAVSTRVITLTSILDAENGATLDEIHYDIESHGVHFSPNGKTLAVTEFCGTFHLWDTERWEMTNAYDHQSHQLNTITYSPDGQLLASGGENGKIMIWPGLQNPNQGLLDAGDVWSVSSVRFFPQGELLAVACGNGSVQVWDTEKEAKLFSTPERLALSGWQTSSPYESPFYALHPVEKRLAISVYSREGVDEPQSSRVEIWDFEKQELTQTLPRVANVKVLSYSPDGKQLAMFSGATDAGAAADGTLQLVNLETATVVQSLPITSTVLHLAFSPDGKLLATVGAEIDVWDLARQEVIATLADHIQPVGNSSALQFSPDGSLLASAGYDSRVIIWNTKTWDPVHRLSGHQGRLIGLAFSQDGDRMVSCGQFDNQCTLWDVNTGHPLARFKGNSAAFSPDGTTLAVGGYIPYQTPEEEPPELTSVRLYRSNGLHDED